MTHSANALLPTSSSPRYKMTTLENATSRSAETAASASSPDTAAYGDQPVTSSVKSVARSTGAPPTSASIAFDNTSLRDSLIAISCPLSEAIARQLLQSDARSSPEHLCLRRRELGVRKRAR